MDLRLGGSWRGRWGIEVSEGQAFSRFLGEFVGKHPEWFGLSASERAAGGAVEARGERLEAGKGVELGVPDGWQGVDRGASGDDWAEEVRDEEAEAEEAEVLAGEGD